MEKKHVLIGFALLAGIFVLSCIQTYKIMSMTSSSSFENQQMASLLTGIIKSSVPPASAPTPPTTSPIRPLLPTWIPPYPQWPPPPPPPPPPRYPPPPIVITPTQPDGSPCLPGVDYPLPGGGTYCFKPVGPGQTLNLSVCFPYEKEIGDTGIKIIITVCLKIIFAQNPLIPNSPYVLEIIGDNWWNNDPDDDEYFFFQCKIVGPAQNGGLILSCVSNKWAGAVKLCFANNGNGFQLYYCGSLPIQGFFRELFYDGPQFFPFTLDPRVTRPGGSGYIPPEWIPSLSKKK